MADPYQILGVSKSATADEIKSAYRKLAKKLHPDLNPGRKDIEQKFKEVTAAYDLLSDADKRARYDRGEVDAQGNERGFGGFGGGGSQYRTYSPRGGAGAGGGMGGDPFAHFDMDDILSEFMGAAGAGRGRRGGSRNAPGNDTVYSLSIPFTEAAL